VKQARPTARQASRIARRAPRIAALPLVSLFALLPSASCSRDEAASAPPPPLVRVVRLKAAPEQPLELRGSVVSRSRIRLGFKQGGVVAAVEVSDGATVRKGQRLAALDEVDARAQLRAALSLQEKARRDAERATRLAGEGAVASNVRDDALTQLEAAEARVTQARDALRRTKLDAPAAGTVFARLAEPGETVGAGAPILVLDTTDALLVKAAATAEELRELRLGQAASLAPDAGGASLPARVTSLAATPNPSDGLYAVEVTPAESGDLLPGALVRIRFAASHGTPALRIPLEALVHREDRDFAFLLEGSRVRQVPVEVGEAEGREIVVRSGLQGDERVVAEGAYFLQDGQPVRVLE
jgi:multidrug efflux system membrane fusion protein